MEELRKEIEDTPIVAKKLLKQPADTRLPDDVLYIGMGSSYYAALTLKYAGINIYPEIASEFYYYSKPVDSAVLISQSGESSETLWCIDKLNSFISITNGTDSTLAVAEKNQVNIDIKAGPEKMSSTKSYINTLITLYQGHGLDIDTAVITLDKSFSKDNLLMEQNAKKIAEFISDNQVHGLYILGSGPNYGSALQSALVLSETTKLAWQGMTVAQYDHGPKETANGSIILYLGSDNSKDSKRMHRLEKALAGENSLIISLNSPLNEISSPIHLINKLNLLMYYLAKKLDVGKTFTLGAKVTRVEDKIR